MENQQTTTQETAPPIEPEIMPEETALTRPALPVTVEELANLPGEEGLQKIKNRAAIVEHLRRASIALTYPQDYLLFKTKEGAVTAFCQDSGCKRFWQIWGVEITPKGQAQVIKDEETGEFAVQVIGDGTCRATGLFVYDIMGVRYSTEDFCKDVEPLIKKQVRVTQAAIANRDGNIIRALTGMKNVALEELDSVWKVQGAGKSSALCSLGKGFGPRSERTGATGTAKGTPTDIPAPICEVCQKKMIFRPASTSGDRQYPAFWACPDNKKVDGKWTHSSINDEEYRKNMAKQHPPNPQGA